MFRPGALRERLDFIFYSEPKSFEFQPLKPVVFRRYFFRSTRFESCQLILTYFIANERG